MNKRGFFFTLWSLSNHILATISGGRLVLHTSRQTGNSYNYTKLSDYGYSLESSSCIVFEAKACSVVHVALMQEDDDNKPMYEVLFGGWGNSKSVIRIGKHTSNIQAQRMLSGVVDCNEFRKLQVSWKDGEIAAYRWKKSCEWELLMSFYSTSINVKYIGVTTGIWRNGDWIIYEGCREPLGNFWMKDISMKDAIFSSPSFIQTNSRSSIECAVQCQINGNCCYFTYKPAQRECRGFLNIHSPTASLDTRLWKRP